MTSDIGEVLEFDSPRRFSSAMIGSAARNCPSIVKRSLQ
jgi:hypothetical protein